MIELISSTPYTCVIAIGRARYEYRFETQTAVTRVLDAFKQGWPGRGLNYAKRHAKGWERLKQEKA